MLSHWYGDGMNHRFNGITSIAYAGTGILFFTVLPIYMERFRTLGKRLPEPTELVFAVSPWCWLVWFSLAAIFIRLLSRFIRLPSINIAFLVLLLLCILLVAYAVYLPFTRICDVVSWVI